jgi:hypothetical protein
VIEGPLPQTWRVIAQGGEEGRRTFMNVRDELRELAPKYVRIDHIYDQYNLVSRNNGQLIFNWDDLDQTVRDILVSGAKPFFALSYMPAELSGDATIIGKPRDWSEWQLLVASTIEHYSGKEAGQMGLEDVYYEVWNEPDLFGNWKTYGDKNYLELYYFASRGAQRVVNTNRFFLGGPATTAPYRNWIVSFLKYARQGNLKLDFISWHRYSKNPSKYRKDLLKVRSWIRQFNGYSKLPLIISEFGFDSENNPAHDNRIAAAHTAAVIRQVIPEVELAFNFELKDGPSPSGKKFWGRWGVLTHDQFANSKKPRFFTLKLLNELHGRKINVSGEGDFVKAIAAFEFGKIKVLLVNYDPQNRHAEKVPVSLTNLSSQKYNILQKDIDQNQTTTTKQTVNGTLAYQVIMPPNSVILLTFSPAD